MKKQRIVIGLCCLLNIISASASVDHSAKINHEPSITTVSPYSLHAGYSYRDFKFNATSLPDFVRFKGHSNLYLAGVNSIKIKDSLHVGLFINNVDSTLNISLPLGITINDVVHSDSLFGHVLKRIKPNLFIDWLGGLGQNAINYKILASGNPGILSGGYASSRSTNWYTSIKAIYRHPWKKFLFTGNFGALYSQVNQEQFPFLLNPPQLSTNVAQLSNQSTYLLESAEVIYQFKPNVQPFLTGGLIQVLQYSNNRPIISVTTAGSPDFNLDKSGFEVGAGFSLKYKQYVFRLEQQYYQRGSIYHSNQSMATLKVVI